MSQDHSPSNPGRVLGRASGPMLEFVPEPDAEALAVLIVAFANAAGGSIVIGMDTSGSVQPNVVEDLEPLLERALGLCEPPFREMELPQWFVEDTSQGQVCTIVVRPTPYQMSVAGTQVYVRSGRMNLRLSPNQVAAARSAAQETRFEDEVVPGATLDDLDPDIIEEYRLNRIKRGPRGESFTRLELLRDAGAIDAANNPTGAGILLFGRNPHYFFPQVGVVIVRFKGNSLREAALTSERYSRRIELVGPAPRLVEGAWQALFDEVHQRSVTNGGLARQEHYEYPLEAVREAVVNALCHRDYRVSGQRIEIRLFDDRMEILSPGRLPGHITLENLMEEHYSRNPRLVRGLYYWGYIEELGQGIDIIYEAMHRDHHPPPEFREGERSFAVTLMNKIDQIELQYGDEINPRQILALRHLQEHERITNREYHSLCPDVTTETLRLDLRDLISKGILLQVGSKRGTYYVLKGES